MYNRGKLDNQLRNIIKNGNVYFQPPESLKINYPCIIYNHLSYPTIYANNETFIRQEAYQIILIDKDPDSKFNEEILKLKFCSFNRRMNVNNLNHYYYNITL